ncbi:helix-turn-helix domain-containing protein [Candidatus Poribacteria bacterium]|nr:helix-turn-helix domain-containing protein [Candidatus Poribacteria bacterium]
MQDTYTAVEAARAVNVSEATIRNYIRAGKLSAEKDGTSWSITREQLEAAFGYVMELDEQEAERPATGGLPVQSDAIVKLVEAATQPVGEAIDLLRAQLAVKDQRIAELEAHIERLQGQVSQLATQVAESASSQNAAWQEFIRQHTEQLATLATARMNTRDETPRRRWFQRWFSK